MIALKESEEVIKRDDVSLDMTSGPNETEIFTPHLCAQGFRVGSPRHHLQGRNFLGH